MAELSVALSARVKKFLKELDKAEKGLIGVEKQAQDTKKTTTNVVPPKAASQVQKFTKSTANATPAMLEFNRTIQDAPFGIQGVANNIQQLTANFGNLSRNAGGPINALKAMAGTLLGPQGILLGVSLVTAGLVAFGDKISLASSLTDKLAKSTAKFVAEANTEIATLQTLFKIAKDETQSKKVRLGAIDDLNEKYGEYLGNLDLENIKTKEIKASVDALTASLLKQAAVKGLEARLAEIYEDTGEELSGLLLKQREAAKQVKAELNSLRNVDAFSGVSADLPLTEQIKQVVAIVNRNRGAGQGLLAGLGISVANFNKAIADTKAFKKDLVNELSPIQVLLDEFTAEKLFTDLEKGSEGVVVIGKKAKGTQKKFKDLTNQILELESVFELEDAIENAEFAQKVFVETGAALKEATNQEGFDDGYWESFFKIQQLEDINNRITRVIEDGLITALSGIGDAIGNTVVNGGNFFNALGATLLSAAGGIAIQLGQIAIGIGLGIESIKTALATLAGPVAIAAGVALVALGSAFKAGAAKLSGSFNGGGLSGGVSGTGSFSGSTQTGGVQTFGNGEFVFRISGYDLVAVQNKVISRNKRLGGNVSIG